MDKENDEKRARCLKVIQFPQSAAQKFQSEVLPDHFKSQPLSSGLRHLVDLASKATQKQVRGQTYYLLGLDELDSEKLQQNGETTSNGALRIPQDFLSPQELEALRPQMQHLGFEEVFDTSYEIPFLTTYAIPQITIHGYTQILAATADGTPVLLEHLPLSRKPEKLNDRASAAAALAGLKILSDKRVLPKLLGVTRTEDGDLMAVLPLPAGYESVQVTSIRIGTRILMGARSGKAAEPFEQQNDRIQPFERLIDRMLDSQWPMQGYSLDLEAISAQYPTLKVSELFDLLKLPLWENQGKGPREPFFYPSYFAPGNSTWLPALLSNPMVPLSHRNSMVENIEITLLSNDRSLPLRDRMAHIPLQKIDPTSKFGRITLLRYDFFLSLLNGKAKVNYLNFLLEKSPAEQKSLIDLIASLATPLKKEFLLPFISNYQAKRYREAFEIIDGRSP